MLFAVASRRRAEAVLDQHGSIGSRNTLVLPAVALLRNTMGQAQKMLLRDPYRNDLPGVQEPLRKSGSDVSVRSMGRFALLRPVATIDWQQESQKNQVPNFYAPFVLQGIKPT